MESLKIELSLTDYSEESIMDRVVSHLTDQLQRNIEKQVHDRMRKVIDDVLQAKAESTVAEYLTRPMQKTNHYGEPVGAPITMTEMIAVKFDDHMKECVDTRGNKQDVYSSNKGDKRLDWIIKQICSDKLESVVSAAVKEARQKGEDAMKNAIAELIAKHVK